MDDTTLAAIATELAKRRGHEHVRANLHTIMADRLGAVKQEASYMKVIVDFCLVPIGVGVSVSRYVTACQRVVADAGLEPHLHAYGTTIEGDWETVFAAVRRCHETIHEMGAPRISTSIRLGTRTDRQQSIESKVKSVKDQLRASNSP